MNSYIFVALLGGVDIWLVIPVIFAFKLDPFVAMLFAGIGSALGALLSILLSVKFRSWVVTTFHSRPVVSARTKRFMDRYGTAGFGLLTPLILGPVLSCAAAVALGANPRSLAKYAVAGSFVWGVGLGILIFVVEYIKGL